ncbi:MAG: cytochrome c [Acidobacteriota bacterium]|nr:cytochrome c [Acidobacteriota bacterium]
MRLTRLAIAYLLLSIPAGFAQDPSAFYKRNCAACHSIGGGRLLGPDLKGVEDRKDRKWLTEFLLNPKATLDQGDPYGKKLLADAKGMVMPQVKGIDRPMAEALLDYIAGGGASPAGGAEKAFTAADTDRGRALVTGAKRLTNGGPPCAACHGFAALPGAGGGRLGPDLTGEFARLGGRKGLSTWLASPPTPTMQAVYGAHPLKPEEIAGIAAWLKSQPPDSRQGRRGLLLLALLGPLGCVAGLLIMNAAWSRRFTAVRRPLAMGNSRQERSKS